MKQKRKHDPFLSHVLPNGFASWHETHFEVVKRISECQNTKGTLPYEIYENHGTGGLYDLALSLTDKFELAFAGRQWDGDFFDEIDKFLDQEIQQVVA